MTSDEPVRAAPRRRAAGRDDALRALLLAPLLLPFGAMLQRQHVRGRPAPQPLPAELPLGLSIAGDAVVNRHADGRIQAWSARCTHLGCRLDRGDRRRGGLPLSRLAFRRPGAGGQRSGVEVAPAARGPRRRVRRLDRAAARLTLRAPADERARA